MTFPTINNPLGGGYAGQLPNLAAGVQALQQTEIQRRLADIKQQKEWDRDDMLRTEKMALEAMSIDPVNDLRVQHARMASKEADELTDYAARVIGSARKQGRGASGEEIIELQNKMRRVMANNANAKAFIDYYDEQRKNAIATRAKITDPELQYKYDQQWADLNKKINDYGLSGGISTYDVAEAAQAPEPTANVVAGRWRESLTPVIKKAYTAGVNGVKTRSFDEVVSTVRANMQNDRYGLDIIKRDRGYETDEQVYEDMAKSLWSAIEHEGGRTTGSGATQDKKNQAVFAASVDNLEGGTSSGVKLRNASSINLVRDVKSKSGESFRSIDEFTPTQITKHKNGDLYVEGNVSVSKGESRIVTAEDLAVNKYVFGITAADAKKVGTDDGGNDLYEVPAKVSGTVTLYRPYSEFKEELSAIIPNLQNEVAKIKGGKSQQSSSGKTFTIQGESYTYDELKGAGWSDEQINKLNK